jgi:hypothetical protein
LPWWQRQYTPLVYFWDSMVPCSRKLPWEPENCNFHLTITKYFHSFFNHRKKKKKLFMNNFMIGHFTSIRRKYTMEIQNITRMLSATYQHLGSSSKFCLVADGHTM